jgi:hypothetical protein
MYVEPILVFATGLVTGAITWATLGEWTIRSLARYLATH